MLVFFHLKKQKLFLHQASQCCFHKVCKKACDLHNYKFYREYKKKCDEYFWNTHRNEARGIGGLFFDYLRPNEKYSIENWYDFVTEVGNHFLEAYLL